MPRKVLVYDIRFTVGTDELLEGTADIADAIQILRDYGEVEVRDTYLRLAEPPVQPTEDEDTPPWEPTQDKAY